MQSNYVPISQDVANDEARLIAEAVKNFGGDFESKVDIEESWTTYTVKLFESSSIQRLIVFRPPSSSRFFNCIRVRNPQGAVEWEVLRKSDTYMGLVPTDCQFEAMLVELKLFTRKKDLS
ncbi:uncharacterized protein AKAW2_30035A [Aspergillus luchuensis]|uniref:Uncharacterized protein n=1 Tax=Aspergillus kawachii TaxID=1069201 RepID=A0A7R7WU69_ASPKA|nr:uncharacterized protein AKAW2_30035A [Aspergillus luchuensis]BCR96716.1 hypothetical protein AKAW2_30035A [Aspergillus luchuensis]BCS09212.1 hypothetical protein ALUC_30029A [Aspergillus luchuensis]